MRISCLCGELHQLNTYKILKIEKKMPISIKNNIYLHNILV